MTTSRKAKAGWERAFPEITGPWTHWRLLGDGRPLADIAGDDLLGALRVVEANFDKFRSIIATRLSIAADGTCSRNDKSQFVIARRKFDAKP